MEINGCIALIQSKMTLLYERYQYYLSTILKNPYARLIRLDRPIGTWLLIIPVLWATALASQGILSFIYHSMIFSIGAFAMRGAGCIMNDIVDRDIVKKVDRTRSRPLASGELRMIDALKLLFVLLSVSLIILLTLPMTVIYIGILAVFPVALYPFMKRITFYPQLFLGIVFNIGIIMAWITVRGEISVIAILLYMAAVMWTFTYDTIYAFQDLKDDEKIGVYSTAMVFRENVDDVVTQLYQGMSAMIFIIGMISNLNLMFYIIFAVAVFYCFSQSSEIDYNDPSSCGKAFRNNKTFGLLLLLAFVVGRI